MDCSTARKLVTPYIKKELDTREVEKFIAHIKTCKECYEELEIYFTIHFALQQLDEKEPLSYDINKRLHENLKTTEQRINKNRRHQIYGLAMVVLTQIVIILTLVTQLQIWNCGNVENTVIYRLRMGDSNNIHVEEEILDGSRENQILDNNGNINSKEESPADPPKKIPEENVEEKSDE